MNRLERHGFWLTAAGVLVLMAALLLLQSGSVSYAQKGNPVPTLTPTVVPSPTLSPTPNPTATAAAAFFTVEQAEMVSHYPEGVEYIFRATSSAGSIDRVQVRHWRRDATISSAQMDWDEQRQAFVYFDRMYRPPWFEINFSFRASDSAGNILQTDTLTREYADFTHKWIRRENDEIIVLLFGARESLADDLFASAAEAIHTLEGAFGFELDYKPYVVVMPDQESFQQWQEYPEPYLAGVTYDTLGYTVQKLQWGEQDLIYATVPHELTHIYQGAITSARGIPAWFTEGHATYFEPIPQYDYEQRVRDIVNDPAFPTLQGDISTEFPGPDGQNRLAYDVGYTFIKYWIDTYGMESHRIFWQAQLTMSFREALAFATGATLAQMENGWRAYLGARGPAPTLIPTLTPLPFPTSPAMPTLPGS